jgi:hypothetical protein
MFASIALVFEQDIRKAPAIRQSTSPLVYCIWLLLSHSCSRSRSDSEKSGNLERCHPRVRVKLLPVPTFASLIYSTTFSPCRTFTVTGVRATSTSARSSLRTPGAAPSSSRFSQRITVLRSQTSTSRLVALTVLARTTTRPRVARCSYTPGFTMMQRCLLLSLMHPTNSAQASCLQSVLRASACSRLCVRLRRSCGRNAHTQIRRHSI